MQYVQSVSLLFIYRRVDVAIAYGPDIRRIQEYMVDAPFRDFRIDQVARKFVTSSWFRFGFSFLAGSRSSCSAKNSRSAHVFLWNFCKVIAAAAQSLSGFDSLQICNDIYLFMHGTSTSSSSINM